MVNEKQPEKGENSRQERRVGFADSAASALYGRSICVVLRISY